MPLYIMLSLKRPIRKEVQSLFLFAKPNDLLGPYKHVCSKDLAVRIFLNICVQDFGGACLDLQAFPRLCHILRGQPLAERQF